MIKGQKKEPLTASRFMALSDAEKEAIYRECETIGPESGEPLTPQQKALHARFLQKAGGRSRAHKASARVQATVARGLLKRADAYAKRHGMTRSQLIAIGIEHVLTT
jgi:hypothetical protein